MVRGARWRPWVPPPPPPIANRVNQLAFFDNIKSISPLSPSWTNQFYQFCAFTGKEFLFCRAGCGTVLMPKGLTPKWLLGLNFFEAFYAEFDFDKSRIGFAPLSWEAATSLSVIFMRALNLFIQSLVLEFLIKQTVHLTRHQYLVSPCLFVGIFRFTSPSLPLQKHKLLPLMKPKWRNV